MIYEIQNDSFIIEQSSCTPAQLGFLEELIDIGRASIENNIIKLPIDTVYHYKTDDDDLFSDDTNWRYVFSLLQLAPIFTDTIKLSYTGGLGQHQFRIETFYNNRRVTGNGPFLKYEKDGAILGIMPPELYEFYLLTRSISRVSILKLLNYHRKILAQANKLESKNLIEFDGKNVLREFYEIQQPLKLDVRLNKEDTSIDIIPIVSFNNEEPDIQTSWEKAFHGKRPEVEAVEISIDSSANHNRYIILDEKQNEQINTVQEIVTEGKKNPERIREFFANPEQFVDPEIIDTEDLSQRIADYGVFQTFSFPNNSSAVVDWWGNIVFSAGAHEIIKITRENIKCLEDITQEAEKNRIELVKIGDQEIPTSLLREKIENYKEFLLTGTIDVDKVDEKKVYIAKSNIVDIDYEETIEKLAEFTFKPLNDKQSFSLKQHQVQGIAWLQNLAESKLKGGLLADDMGLGKTIQILYFLEWMQENRRLNKEKRLKVCLVVPLSLIQNWKSEYEKFFPKGRLFFYDDKLKEYLRLLTRQREDYGSVHLVTYQTLQRNQVDYAKVTWDLIITDEIQYSKNPGTRITNALKTLQSGMRIGMTGTPVENKFDELWNIMDWISPGLLGSLSTFKKEYALDAVSSIDEVCNIGRRLREKIGDLMIRRTKDQVLSDELPKKIIHNDCVSGNHEIQLNATMTKTQLEYYNSIRAEAHRSNDKLKALGYIQRMKIVSDHPRFLDSKIFPEHMELTEKLYYESAKTMVLDQILEQIKDKAEKALVFCEFRFTQHLISGWISKKFGIRVPVLNGSSPIYDTRKTSFSRDKENELEGLSRQSLVERFNKQEGFAVLVLSPIAAGVGLNITGANHVIHFSRHWNPAKEEQATDRAYRIGQKKDVHVYYPKAIGKGFNSFDVNVARIIERKRTLSKGALYPSNFEDRMIDLNKEFFS